MKWLRQLINRACRSSSCSCAERRSSAPPCIPQVEILEGRVLLASRLFAVLTSDTGRIYELNPSTGAVITKFAAPEAATGSADGLAVDGTSLFYMSGNGNRRLY